jgi:hypothetical protein
MPEKKEKVFTFCSNQNCCPVLTVRKNTVEIGEDGNRVILTKQQFKDLKKLIKSEKV